MSIEGWKPMRLLILDGRKVLFKSEAGEFEAPAIAPREATRKEAVAMIRAGSEWPNVKFNPTHWKELSQADFCRPQNLPVHD
jgi:hypothetical protein